VRAGFGVVVLTIPGREYWVYRNLIYKRNQLIEIAQSLSLTRKGFFIVIQNQNNYAKFQE